MQKTKEQLSDREFREKVKELQEVIGPDGDYSKIPRGSELHRFVLEQRRLYRNDVIRRRIKG